MSAGALVKVLSALRGDASFGVYLDSLAVPGVDRSVRERMKGEPLAREMRLKRGTVSRARNLAGTLRSRGGRLYAFALLVNGPALDRRAVDEATDRLVLGAVRLLP